MHQPFTSQSRIYIVLTAVLTFIAAYYTCILLHEWFGHGLVAWLFGDKNSPFDIYYGGWALLYVDENVDYNQLVSLGKTTIAALIGISGVTINLLFFILCLTLLPRANIQKKKPLFMFLYWALLVNLVPMVQYFSLTAFASKGDVGHFTHGLNISPWWIFIPGTLFVIAALWRLLRVEVPRSYAIISIQQTWIRRIFLAFTLFIVFLMIYTHGYNPLTDSTTPLLSKILVLLTIALVPVLLIGCDPSRDWVKKAVQEFEV